MTSAERPHTSSCVKWLKGEWNELNFRKAEFILLGDENGDRSQNVALIYNWLQWSLPAQMEVVAGTHIELGIWGSRVVQVRKRQ